MVMYNRLKYFIIFSDTTSWTFFQLLRKWVVRIFHEKMKMHSQLNPDDVTKLVCRTHRAAAVQVSVTVVIICHGLRCLPFSKISVACFGFSIWAPAHCLALLWFRIKKKSLIARGFCLWAPKSGWPWGMQLLSSSPSVWHIRGLPCWAVNGRWSSGIVWLDTGQVYSWLD